MKNLELREGRCFLNPQRQDRTNKLRTNAHNSLRDNRRQYVY